MTTYKSFNDLCEVITAKIMMRLLDEYKTTNHPLKCDIEGIIYYHVRRYIQENHNANI
jgi:hypothetical protein